MRVVRVALVLLTTATILHADPTAEAEVVAAVGALQRAKSYSWDVGYGVASIPPRRGTRNDGTMRTTQFSEIRESGQTGDGMTLVTQPATEKGPAQLAASRDRRIAIAETPDGWLTREEVLVQRKAASNTEIVEFKGRKMFKTDALTGASLALMRVPPAEQLLTLVNDIESFSREGFYILGKLSEAGHRRLNPGRVRPGEHTTVVFWIVSGELREFMISRGRGPSPAPGVRAGSNLEYTGFVARIFHIDATVPMIPPEALAMLLR